MFIILYPFKMAAGFNRRESGRGGMEDNQGGNISPWIHRPDRNAYPPPLPIHPPMPHPPPPPSLRFDRVPSATPDYYQEDIQRNPYQRRTNSNYTNFDRGEERRNGGIERDRHMESHQSSSHFDGRRDNGRSKGGRYENERDQRNYNGRKRHHQRSGYDGFRDRRDQRNSENYRKYDSNNSANSAANTDIECISPWPTSPVETSDVNQSPDITEVPVQQDCTIVLNSSGLEQPPLAQSGASRLEQAYRRRVSQNTFTGKHPYKSYLNTRFCHLLTFDYLAKFTLYSLVCYVGSHYGDNDATLYFRGKLRIV